MKTEITRRKMIGMMVGVAGFIPALKYYKEEPVLKTENDRDFLTHYCGSGSTVGSNLEHCISMAKRHKARVIFVFNYCDIFEVYPDGTWICKRTGGGMPVIGPNSEFVPKEGWSKFYGH